MEEQQRAKEIAHDELINAERKANTNQNALEESRTLLEQSDRARRMVEQELADTNETLSEQTCANQAIQGGKHKLESEMSTLQVNLLETKIKLSTMYLIFVMLRLAVMRGLSF